jgi:hypothetical protein
MQLIFPLETRHMKLTSYGPNFLDSPYFFGLVSGFDALAGQIIRCVRSTMLQVGWRAGLT